MKFNLEHFFTINKKKDFQPVEKILLESKTLALIQYETLFKLQIQKNLIKYD